LEAGHPSPGWKLISPAFSSAHSYLVFVPGLSGT
jgi:hypothetical protein